MTKAFQRSGKSPIRPRFGSSVKMTAMLMTMFLFTGAVGARASNSPLQIYALDYTLRDHPVVRVFDAKAGTLIQKYDAGHNAQISVDSNRGRLYLVDSIHKDGQNGLSDQVQIISTRDWKVLRKVDLPGPVTHPNVFTPEISLSADKSVLLLNMLEVRPDQSYHAWGLALDADTLDVRADNLPSCPGGVILAATNAIAEVVCRQGDIHWSDYSNRAQVVHTQGKLGAVKTVWGTALSAGGNKSFSVDASSVFEHSANNSRLVGKLDLPSGWGVTPNSLRVTENDRLFVGVASQEMVRHHLIGQVLVYDTKHWNVVGKLQLPEAALAYDVSSNGQVAYVSTAGDTGIPSKLLGFDITTGRQLLKVDDVRANIVQLIVR